MTEYDLEKIKNHVSNLPSVAQLYVPELVSALETAIKERDSARGELEFIQEEYVKVSTESLTRDALELRLAAIELTMDKIFRMVDELKVLRATNKDLDGFRVHLEEVQFDALREVVREARNQK